MKVQHVGLDWKVRSLHYAIPAINRYGLLKLKDTGKDKVILEDAGRALGEWLMDQAATWDLGRHTMPAFWIETPFAGFLPGGRRNISTALKSAMTVGAILAMAPGDIHLIDQSSWKKEIVGSGTASKHDVGAWLQTHHPDVHAACQGVEDLQDAACIALYGQLAAQGEVP